MPRTIHPIPFVIHPSDELGKNIDLRNLSRDLATKYVDGHVVTDDDLQIMGRNLWNGLSADVQGAFETARKEAGEKILPVVIHSDAADVQALPWETLFHPMHGFIGKNLGFTLTRQLSSKRERVSLLDKGPLRVLLFTSLPDDVNPETGRLNVEDEQVQVQEALLPWISKGFVKLEMPDDGRFSTLKELLKSFQPHILFLSGHGRFHHEQHADQAYGEFLFESEAGDGEAINEDKIADMLIGVRVQAVILSACESGKAASDVLSNGLMRRISSQGIPHVIGMRESILDKAGIQFARALCDALAQAERIDFALQAARIAIQTQVNDITADERSFGQWCLPMLISSGPHTPLIDWSFQPKEIDGARLFKSTLGDVSLPARFVGRRAEMRQYKNKLFKGEFYKLLITGPGGQGKTSLAGKLALDMQKHGWQIFAWSAKLEKSWHDFELEMEQTLEKPRVDRYNQFLPHAENEVERAKFMLSLLMEQFNGRVILFLDNLEAIQDPATRALNDAFTAAWMDAANKTQDLILLATSRWQIPNWNGEHLFLDHANLGDFLQIAQELALPISMLEKRYEMRHLHKVLGGNIRGLEFFAAAVRSMQNADEEHAFLDVLAQTKLDLQANMAIEELYKRLPEDAQILLQRLPTYYEPVPFEGLVKLGSGLPNPEAILERLLAFSLLEAGYEPHWDVPQYQCTPMVTDWMRERGLMQENAEWLNVAADYLLYLLANGRDTLSQAITVYNALRRTGRDIEADRLTLDYIVGPLTMAGLYATLLEKWLPRICNSEDLQMRAEALGQMGKLLIHTGNYDTALSYLEQALTIRQQIGDKTGEGVTLNNISQIYDVHGDYDTALSYLKQSLVIRQQTSDKLGESTTLNNISGLYQAQGDYETALFYLKQSLVIKQQIDDQAGVGTTLNNISQIFKAQGDYKTALSYLKQSLVIRQQTGDKAGEGTTLNNISGLYQAQGDYETALSYMKQSLVISQQIGDKSAEARALNNISQTYHAQGDYETAFSYLKQSLAIMQQIGDKANEGVALNNISALYYAQGAYETALSYMKQSLAISQQIGNKSLEGRTLNNISALYYEQGDYKMALSYMEQSLAISQQIGDKANEGTTLNNISALYCERGDYKMALSYMMQSLATSRQIGDKAIEATTLNNISTLYYEQSDYETALSYMKQSLAIFQQIGDKANEGTTLSNISGIFWTQDDYETALFYLKQALEIQQQIGDKLGLCKTLISMGHIHKQNNQTQEAIDIWLNSYLIARQLGFDQILRALAELAAELEIPEGLEGWEMLAQRRQSRLGSE